MFITHSNIYIIYKQSNGQKTTTSYKVKIYE